MAVKLAEFKTTFLAAGSLESRLNQRCPDTPTFFVKEAPFVASGAHSRPLARRSVTKTAHLFSSADFTDAADSLVGTLRRGVHPVGRDSVEPFPQPSTFNLPCPADF
jgi:hypothetical protein